MPATAASLLDVDPSLARVLGPRQAATTGRRRLLEVVQPPPGDWTPVATSFAVLDGLLLRAAGGDELPDVFGPGDIIGGQPRAATWTAGPHARLAVTGPVFVSLVRPWPEVERRLAARLVRQDASRAALRAAAAAEDPEERVLAVLWALIARWGRPAHDGMVLVPELDLHGLARVTGLERAELAHVLRSQTVRLAGGRWWMPARSSHRDGLLRRRDELRVRLARQLSAARVSQRHALTMLDRFAERPGDSPH
jgi:hypothetical protein